MARIPVVTRTITSTKAVVLAVDTVNEELVEKTVILPRTYNDETAIKKAIVNLKLLPDTLVVSKVKDTEVSEKRYSMTEEKFIEHADVID